MSDLPHPPVQTPRPSLALRLVGMTLLVWSVGLVSCQAMFVF